MSNFLSELIFPVVFRPRRRIADFDAYLCIDETGSDDLELTEHPVQQGAAITDHAFVKPAQLAIRAQFNEFDSGMPLDELYRRLLELQSSRIPFDVVTGKRLYKNMLFKSLSVTTDQYTSNVLSITAQLQEIIIVSVEVTTVPPRDRQAEPGRTGATERAGQKKAQPVAEQDQPRAKSALATIAGGFNG